MKIFTFLTLIATALAAPALQAAGGNCTANAQSSCAAIRAQLEAGIQSNLDIQAKELDGVKLLQAQEGTAAFAATQKNVLCIQQQGIDIRANNQKLAKQINSPAADGLAIVAGAQVKEMTQVQSLKGDKGATDAETLKMLVQEVNDGTTQNKKNLDAAKAGKC